VRPFWSPVAHFGGYQSTVKPSTAGGRQAELLAQAAAESELQRQWQIARRGAAPSVPGDAFETTAH
jgi:hypothetical protein